MVDPGAKVRLEYRPFPEEAQALDLRLANQDEVIAVELKHLTKALDVTVGGERFVLKNQGAYPIIAYDCFKDLERLDRFVSAGVADRGYLVVLSNDALYWKPPAQPGAGYDAFRIYDGLVLGGTLEWGERAGSGTRRGRESPLVIGGPYELHWRDYSTVGVGLAETFRVLVVEVGGRFEDSGVVTILLQETTGWAVQDMRGSGTCNPLR